MTDITKLLRDKGYNPAEILKINGLRDFSGVKIAKDGTFRLGGRYLKGTTGNLSGKTKDLGTVLKEQDRDFGEIIATMSDEDKRDPMKMAMALLQAAKTFDEAKSITNILLPYVYPKKQSVESINHDIKRIVIVQDETAKLLNAAYENLTDSAPWLEHEITEVKEDD